MKRPVVDYETCIGCGVYGATFMLSSGSTDRLNAIELEGSVESTRFKKIAHEAMRSATFLEFALGMSAVVLGITALGLHC